MSPELAGLETRGLTVRFGGLVAVDAIDLQAPLGRITGLIGPNGAGKTTTFAACSGLLHPTAGTVRLFEHDMTKASPQARAQRGLGRTYQRMQLFGSLTVRENVGLGLEAGLARSRPWAHLFSTRNDNRRIQDAVDAALERCGIRDIADRPAGDLSTGQGRLVELARVLAGGFRLLLLDEPSSGLDKTETARFGEILRGIVRETGAGILIVEHDMSLVLGVCDYIYVLDFGKMIFEGTPADVMTSPDVQAAYLGSAELEVTG